MCFLLFLLFLFQCVPVCVYRLHFKFQRLDAALLRNISLRIHLLTFLSCFVIDLLSILKVIIFSAIATDDRHPLRSHSIHQNAENCKTIRFRYIAQRGGAGYSSAHAHIIMCDPLLVVQAECRVRR